MVPQVCDSGVSKGQKGGPAVQPLFKINPISCGRRFEDSGIECCKKLKLFGVFILQVYLKDGVFHLTELFVTHIGAWYTGLLHPAD